MKNLLKKKTQADSPKAKKSLLSSFNKNTTKKTSTKVAARANPSRLAGIDSKKLLPILVGLLILVLAALAAYWFLFNEPQADTTQTVVAETVPIQENSTHQEEGDIADESTPSEPIIQTIDPASIEPASTAPISYEDFIRESQTKLYREHDTTPPELQTGQ